MLFGIGTLVLFSGLHTIVGQMCWNNVLVWMFREMVWVGMWKLVLELDDFFVGFDIIG